MDSVLTGMEPDPDARVRLRRRLSQNGTLGMLHSAWATGGDPTALARILLKAAKELE